MRRRSILMGFAASLSFQPQTADAHVTGSNVVSIDDVAFSWRHADERLHGALTAPTSGWIAVGFNRLTTLSGTRFVIACVREPLVVEMHVAVVPHHPRIETLGGQSGLLDISGASMGGRSRLTFSLPHVSGQPYPIELSPGTSAHLMLAWSHEEDFAHHSAWRRHIDVVL